MPIDALGPPNPLDTYAHVIGEISASYSRVEDAHSYATVWTTNYVSLHQRPEHDDKVLATYLKQRFDALVDVSRAAGGAQ